MKIALFSDTYPPDLNGVSTSVQLQKEALETLGHEVVVITTGLPKQRKVTFQDNVLRIPGITLPFLYGYRLSFPYNHKADKILREFDFDVLHVEQEFGVSLFGRLFAHFRDVPFVYTFHTCYEDYTPYLTRGKKIPDLLLKKIVRKLLKAIGERNIEIVTPSLKAQKILRGYGIDRPIHVLPSPMECLSPAVLPEETLEEEKKRLHIQGKKIALSLGRIAYEKNLPETLSSFLSYQKSHPEVESVLVVVGDGPERERLEEKYPDPDILFLGKVPHEQVSLYYQMSDVFLTSSMTETQGLTILEAMENGLPVLARYDFNLEGFLKDGENALLYDQGKTMPEKIHQAFLLDKESRRRITDNAKETLRKLYDPGKYAERIIQVYEKAIRREL